VGPGITIDDAAAAVGSVLPAIEIIDSRISDWKITITDTIADNASSGAVVLGPGSKTLPTVDQLAACEATMTIDGRAAGTGVGTDVLGNPLAPLAWLANTLGERGETLRAGQLVIPGSFTAARPVTAGAVVEASFSGIGTVRVQFIDSEDEQ
jgi:2-keto-4-pentenoate hydratase